MISITKFLKMTAAQQEKYLNDLQSKVKENEDKQHGRYKYSQGCRCDICKAAKRDSQKKYKAKLTAEKSAQPKG